MLTRAGDEEKHEVMRGLKALVIGMGVLILIGMGIVVVTVAKRTSGEPAAQSAPAPGFVAARPIPNGARVVEMTAVGDLLAVRLELAGGRTRLMLLDPSERRPPSFIDLVPE